VKAVKPATIRLLKYLAERHPLGVASSNALPDDVYDGPGHVGMATAHGLVKRGWATEDHRRRYHRPQRAKRMSKRRTKTKRKRVVLRIEDRAYVSLDGVPAWGVCYKRKHLIEILESLESFNYLDTVIHELLHYYFPEAKEGYVEKIATIIANVLWDRRYRRLAK
jgi:hypothetical protein